MHQMEDISTYVEPLQCLVDLAWPFMDYYTKEASGCPWAYTGSRHTLDSPLTGSGPGRGKIPYPEDQSMVVMDVSQLARVITRPTPNSW